MNRIFVLLTILLCSTGLMAQESIYSLTYFGQCRDISPEGESSLYVGDELFNLINGGAELYHEFGFIEVLALELSVEGKGNLKVEIYDMGSSSGARGIYSLSGTSDADKINIGDAGRAGKGYMQAIKDKYMIYTYSKDLPRKVSKNVIECIAGNIEHTAATPDLLARMEALEPEKKCIYFVGNLGLSSIYNFHYRDVFSYDKGVAAIGENTKFIVLEYPDEDACLEHFYESYSFFRKKKKYHDQELNGLHYHLKDRKEQHLDFFCEGRYLFILIHDGSLDAEAEKDKLAVQMDN